MRKLGGKSTLPLVLQWRGAGGVAPVSLSPPSSERKWKNTCREIIGRQIELLEIGR